MQGLSNETIVNLNVFMKRLMSDPSFIFECEPILGEIIQKDDALAAISTVLLKTEEMDESTKLASIIHIKQIFMPYFKKVANNDEKVAFAERLVEIIKLGDYPIKIKYLIAEIYAGIVENFECQEFLNQIEKVNRSIDDNSLSITQKSLMLLVIKHIYNHLMERSRGLDIQSDFDIPECFHAICDVMLDYQSKVIFKIGLQTEKMSFGELQEYLNCVSLYYLRIYERMSESISQNESSFTCRMFSPEIVVRLVNWSSQLPDGPVLQFFQWVCVKSINNIFTELNNLACKRFKGSEISGLRENFFKLYEFQTWRLITDFQQNKDSFLENVFLRNCKENNDSIALDYVRYFNFLIRVEIPKSVKLTTILQVLVSTVFSSAFAEKLQLQSIEDNPEEILNSSEDAIEGKKSGNATCLAIWTIEDLCSKNRTYFDFIFNLYMLVIETLLGGNQLFQIKSALTEVYQMKIEGTVDVESLPNLFIRNLIKDDLFVPEAIFFLEIGEDFQFIESGFLILTSISDLIKIDTEKQKVLFDFLDKNFQRIFAIPGIHGQLIIQRFYLFFMYTSSFISQEDFQLFEKIVIFGFHYLHTNQGRNVACSQILKTYSNIIEEPAFLAVLHANNKFVLETVYQIIDFKENSWVFKFLLKFNIQTTFLKENKTVTVGFIVKMIEWLTINSYCNNESVSSSIDFLNSCVKNIHQLGFTEEDIIDFNRLFLGLLRTIFGQNFRNFVFSEELLGLVSNVLLLCPDSPVMAEIVKETMGVVEISLSLSETTNRAIFELFSNIAISKRAYFAQLANLGSIVIQSYLGEAKKNNFKAFSSNSLIIEFFLAHDLIAQELQILFLDILFGSISQSLNYLGKIYRVAEFRHKFEQQLLLFVGIVLKNPGFVVINEKNRNIYLRLILIGMFLCITTSNFSEYLSSEYLKLLVRLIPLFVNSIEICSLVQVCQMFLVFNFRKSFSEFIVKCEEMKVFISQILQDKFGLKLSVIEESEDEDEDDEGEDSEDEENQNGVMEYEEGVSQIKSKMNKKEYLKICQTWKINREQFIDEYQEFSGIFERVVGSVERFAADNYNIDFKKGLKELKSIGYHKIDGKMVIRKTIKLRGWN